MKDDGPHKFYFFVEERNWRLESEGEFKEKQVVWMSAS